MTAVALGGWGIGQLWFAAEGPNHPPPLPSRVVALPSAGVGEAARAPGPTPLGRSVPRKIVIPKIGLQAGVEQIGLRADGAIETPSYERANRAAWYRLGPSPGEPGAAVIVGHVDSKKSVAVFFYLTKLRPGDVIEVEREDRTTAVFTVESLESFEKTQFPTDRVYGPTAEPSLRLVTCGGRYDRSRGAYVDNIVVFAHFTGVKPPPPPQV
ncbi:MAG: class F sortase [Hamadaea sp.]|nr:class F sortase [Hamadaea sp.]